MRSRATFQDAIAEPSITPSVGSVPSRVVAPVHLDYQPAGRGQKIYDVLTEHHLPAERGPEAAPGELRPKPRFRERGRRAHDAGAFLEECRASRVLMMRRHDGLLGAAKWPGAAPWSAGCVTGPGRGTRAEPAPGAERECHRLPYGIRVRSAARIQSGSAKQSQVRSSKRIHLKDAFDDPDPNTDDGGKGAPCYDAACRAYR